MPGGDCASHDSHPENVQIMSNVPHEAKLDSARAGLLPEILIARRSRSLKDDLEEKIRERERERDESVIARTEQQFQVS